jgi:hypothetical protein
MKRSSKVPGLMTIGMIALATTANAQDRVSGTIVTDFVNRYIWRGQDLGDVSVQPTLRIAYQGLSVTVFGNMGLSNKDDTKEIDIVGTYTTRKFNAGITNYWFNKPNEQYFCYAAHKTSHVYEANIGYDFGPVTFQWYTNFAGNDGTNKKGNRAYSSYVEINAPFTFADLDWNTTLGAVPYRTSFYADSKGVSVTNISLRASKVITITPSFSMPVFAQITANPSNEKAYFIFGFTLRP